MFHVGQKVECINDQFEDGDCEGGRPNLTVKQRVYTVRAITTFVFGNLERSSCLLLDEINNPICDWQFNGEMEIPFWSGRFRSLVERKTDISIFTEMLAPSSKVIEVV